MKRKFLVLVLILLATQGFSQGVELYVGYPIRFPDKSTAYKSREGRNLNNVQAGFSFNTYIRSVSLQFGLGYLSDNYQFKYTHSTPNLDERSLSVHNNYVNFTFMVYPKLYADGKNVVSLGVGGNLLFPQNGKARYTYDDGTETVGPHGGNYFVVVMPRVSVRYSRWLGKSFYFFANANTDITVMPAYEKNQYKGDKYFSTAILSVDAGVGYFLHRKKGMKQPRYFQPWKKKVKE